MICSPRRQLFTILQPITRRRRSNSASLAAQSRSKTRPASSTMKYHHRRTSSMVQFPSERPRFAGPSKSNREVLQELRTRADELERLFAAGKFGSPGHRMNPAKPSRLGDARASANIVDEMPIEPFGEPASGLVEFDGDLLLNMVDNLQFNMKQSLSGRPQGRLYERYMHIRDAKLRQEWGSSKWARKKEAMKAMEDRLEEVLGEMKVQSGNIDDRKDPILQGPRCLTNHKSFSIGSAGELGEQCDAEDLHEQVQYHQHKFLDTVLIDDSAKSYNSRKLLSSKSVSSSTHQNSAALIPRHSSKITSSNVTKWRTQPEYPLVQVTGDSSDLRKENMKPLTRVRKETTHSDSRIFDRSKRIIAGVDVLKEEKQLKFRHMRNHSVTFGELKELIPLNSDTSSLALSSFPKDQNENTVSKRRQVVGEPKPFLRRGGGIGPGAGASVAKLRISKASNSRSKGEEDEELVNQQEYSADMIGNRDEDFERIWGKHRASRFPNDLDSEEPQSIQELGNSGDFEYLAQDVGSSAYTSKFNESFCNVDGLLGVKPWNSAIHPSFSSVHKAFDIDGSVDFPRGSSASRNIHHLNQMREADASRVRKKWGSVEKPIFATNDSDQPLKEVTKMFKKLFKFGSKRKNTERRLNDSTSTSTSEAGDDVEDASDLRKQSVHKLTKSRKDYLFSANVALHEGRIFPEQARHSFMSFRSFNSRGTEVKA